MDLGKSARLGAGVLIEQIPTVQMQDRVQVLSAGEVVEVGILTEPNSRLNLRFPEQENLARAFQGLAQSLSATGKFLRGIRNALALCLRYEDKGGKHEKSDGKECSFHLKRGSGKLIVDQVNTAGV